tara:strand:+ start:100 stop:555 length:456 start_codon:yes stop_codon:yes gene_type:complete
MKKILPLILLTLIYGCGFTSVYKEQKNQNINIIVEKLNGDFEFNSFLNNELKLISNSASKNIYNLSFISKYNKEIITKDASGQATDYELTVNIEFEIIGDKAQNINFSESIQIEHNSENFEQSNYEKEIKRNFAKSITNKLLSRLITSNDN